MFHQKNLFALLIYIFILTANVLSFQSVLKSWLLSAESTFLHLWRYRNSNMVRPLPTAFLSDVEHNFTTLRLYFTKDFCIDKPTRIQLKSVPKTITSQSCSIVNKRGSNKLIQHGTLTFFNICNGDFLHNETCLIKLIWLSFCFTHADFSTQPAKENTKAKFNKFLSL